MSSFLKGRGATDNPAGRFDSHSIEREEEARSPKTEAIADAARSILASNDSPDIPFHLSLNPYRGCEHGCVYCYARPTHEYLGLSAGWDFESKIFFKEEAPLLLRKELMKKSYVPEVINISGVTDCYQPLEREKRLTRSCLEVLKEFRNPFTIVTKNRLVTRDLDILVPMAELQSAAVFVSVTSLDAELAAKLEPRASRPEARLDAIRALSEAGVPVGVMVAPVIPGITDSEMPRILAAARQAGAVSAGYVPIRLPLSVEGLFTAWLQEHFPDRKERVLSRIRSLRDGKLNDSNFGSRMRGEGQFADLFRQMFELHTRKLGYGHLPELSIGHFERPGTQMGFSF